MADGVSVINIGELSEPITVFIEKVSNAIGIAYKPTHIRRVAKAEAEALKIKAMAQMEISELQDRAIQRFLAEETKKEENIEEIISKALPEIKEDAQSEKMEDDWIANFFDKCRLISDEDMQLLWSKVLAGEANVPGSYSKRTVNLLGSLDKSEAVLFRNLCGFCWDIGDITPLIFEPIDEIYTKNAINFITLKHLDEIGLISFTDNGYQIRNLPKNCTFAYYGRLVNVGLKEENNNALKIGRVLLSKTGQEIAQICNPNPIPDFFDYVITKWKMEEGYSISFPLIS